MSSQLPQGTDRAGSLPLRAYPSLVRRVGYVWGPRLMSALRKRWVLLRHPHAEVRFGKGVYLGPGFSLHIPRRGTFIVGDYVDFRRGFRAEIEGGGRISIGSGSVLTYDVHMQCSTSIEIGARALMGNCLIVDGNHRYRDISKSMLAQGYDYRPIRIEDDAIIFINSTITNSLGKHAVVAANSVVTEPVPAYTLVAGAPAKMREYFGPGAAPGELEPPAESVSEHPGARS